MSSGARAQVSPHRGWCSTLNNYTDDEYATLIAWCNIRAEQRKFRFVIGREVAASGTPHLQCAFWDENRWRFPTAKNSAIVASTRDVETCFKTFRHKFHNETMRGTPQQAFEYCMKEGDFVTNCVIGEQRYVSVEELDRVYHAHRDFLNLDRQKSRAWWSYLAATSNDDWALRNFSLKRGYRISLPQVVAINSIIGWNGDALRTTSVCTLMNL